MASLIDNVTEIIGLFGDVATTDPISAVLLLAGAGLVGFSSLFFGYLTLGAIGSSLIPESAGRGPPQQE
jgi:hypothetical protein